MGRLGRASKVRVSWLAEMKGDRVCFVTLFLPEASPAAGSRLTDMPMALPPMALPLLVCSALAATPVVYDGKIRDEGGGLSAAYMNPYSSDNHAATLEQLPDGSLVAAWFGREHEESSGTAIVVSRLAKGSDTWTNRTIVAQRDGYANGNPLLFYDSTTGTLHLWHTQVKAEAGEKEAKAHRLKSHDGGLVWSDEGQYFDDEGIYIRNRIIRRKDGTLLWPYYTTDSHSNGRAPAFAFSKDTSVPTKGSGWSISTLDQGDASLEQPTCWRQPHDMGTIECYFRDHGDAKSIYSAKSKDEGKTFSNPKPTELPNPDSGIEAYPLQNGDALCWMRLRMCVRQARPNLFGCGSGSPASHCRVFVD